MAAVANPAVWFPKQPPSHGDFSSPNRVLEAMESAWRLAVQTAKPYVVIGVDHGDEEQDYQTIAISPPAHNGEAAGELVDEFAALAASWANDTYYLSGGDIELHPAYLRIISMGRSAVPLILRSLRDQGGHWFWALQAITGTNPAADATTVSGAREAWLRWGHENQLI